VANVLLRYAHSRYTESELYAGERGPEIVLASNTTTTTTTTEAVVIEVPKDPTLP